MTCRSIFDEDALRIEQLGEASRGELLSAYLDDELSPEAARHVTAWLDAHPDALRRLERDRRVWDLLGHCYEDEPVPEAFAARVLAASGQSTGRVLSFRWPALAAAALLLVALGAFLFSTIAGVGPSTPVPPPAESASAALPVDVPAEYLEEADLLLALSDEAFQAYLLGDLEDAWEDS